MSAQQPFDMGAPEPDLPAGSTGMPEHVVTVSYSDPPGASIADAFVFGGGSDAPTAEQLAEIRMLPADQQEFILAWWPHCWNRPSPYIGGKVVLSLTALQLHAEGYMKDQQRGAKRGRPRKQRTSDAAALTGEPEQVSTTEPNDVHSEAYAAWERDCALRKSWIEEKNSEWRRRVAARREALAQWDAFVEAARLEYRNAKATLPPPRPK